MEQVEPGPVDICDSHAEALRIPRDVHFKQYKRARSIIGSLCVGRKAR